MDKPFLMLTDTCGCNCDNLLYFERVDRASVVDAAPVTVQDTVVHFNSAEPGHPSSLTFTGEDGDHVWAHLTDAKHCDTCKPAEKKAHSHK